MLSAGIADMNVSKNLVSISQITLIGYFSAFGLGKYLGLLHINTSLLNAYVDELGFFWMFY